MARVSAAACRARVRAAVLRYLGNDAKLGRVLPTIQSSAAVTANVLLHAADNEAPLGGGDAPARHRSALCAGCRLTRARVWGLYVALSLCCCLSLSRLFSLPLAV